MTSVILLLECIKFLLGIILLVVLLWVILIRFKHGFRNYYLNKVYAWLSTGCSFACNYLRPLVILEQVDYSPLILIFILWFAQRAIDLLIMFL